MERDEFFLYLKSDKREFSGILDVNKHGRFKTEVYDESKTYGAKGFLKKDSLIILLDDPSNKLIFANKLAHQMTPHSVDFKGGLFEMPYQIPFDNSYSLFMQNFDIATGNTIERLRGYLISKSELEKYQMSHRVF